jgi:CcmD family protein
MTFVESISNFLQQNSLYIVLIIVLIVWLGIFSYLTVLDNRLKRIERNEEIEK